jgi:hypothetical protein
MNQSQPQQPHLIVVAAACMNDQRYAHDQPIPGRPIPVDSAGRALPEGKIERMILAGDCVEVFTSDEKHFTLMPPTLLMVMSLASMADWTMLLNNFAEDQIERIEEVLDIMGKTWRVNRGIPVSFDERGEDIYSDEVIVHSIFSNGSMFEVFAVPKVGSEFHQQRLGVKFTLMPLTVQRAIAYAPRSSWEEIIEDVLSEDDGDGDGEGDEPEEEQRVAPAPAPAPAPPPPPSNVLPKLSSLGNLIPPTAPPAPDTSVPPVSNGGT